MIEPIDAQTYGDSLAELIRVSFSTVAVAFHITRETAPSNPAFITASAIRRSAGEKDVRYYGWIEDGQCIGCYALERGDEHTIFLERVAVHPSERHRGIGTRLVQDAIERARDLGAARVSIGIIDEYSTLKRWYIGLGFVETSTRHFDQLPFTVGFLEFPLDDGS